MVKGKKGNTNPVQTEEFKTHIVKASDLPEGVKLCRKALALKLPPEHDAVVRSQENIQAWLRAAVKEKIERDGLI